MPGESVMEALLPHLESWWGALRAIMACSGFVLFLWAVARMAAPGGQRFLGRFVFTLICAVLLINSGGLLDALAGALFGTGSVKSLSYQAPGHPAGDYIQFAVHLVALIGLIGVGRGVLMLKDLDRQPGRLGGALAHIFGGIICVNLVSFLKALGGSMGSGVLELITAITG